jgi:inosine-uridine nucleoside N-ribohydrolase
VRLISAFLILSSALVAKPVWIDTDPSVQQEGVHEVDDGFALVQAFRSKELQIRGVSVVFGNATLEQAFPIGQEIMKRYGRSDVRLFKGAAGPADLGKETEASRALANALQKERLTILALGPATNVATVVQKHPELIKRIDQLIAVAGRREGQRLRPSDDVRSFRDFNFELDPAAFQVLLDSGVRLVLAPWEVSSKVWMTSNDLDELVKADARLDWLVKAARNWIDFWRRDLHTTGFNPFDTLAVAYAITPDSMKCDKVAMKIRQLPDDSAQNSSSLKPYLLRVDVPSGSSAALYCYEASAGFKADLMKRLTRRR